MGMRGVKGLDMPQWFISADNVAGQMSNISSKGLLE